MTTTPQAVANAFLNMADAEGRRLTNMQVQKLVYISYGYYLAASGECLFDSSIKAWQWGPVIPDLYDDLKKYGSGPVTERLSAPSRITEHSDVYPLLKAVWDAYGKMSGAKLSSITHAKGSPWEISWSREGFSLIPDSFIQNHYAAKLKQ